jgi:hypothetical protein
MSAKVSAFLNGCLTFPLASVTTKRGKKLQKVIDERKEVAKVNVWQQKGSKFSSPQDKECSSPKVRKVFKDECNLTLLSCHSKSLPLLQGLITVSYRYRFF